MPNVEPSFVLYALLLEPGGCLRARITLFELVEPEQKKKVRPRPNVIPIPSSKEGTPSWQDKQCRYAHLAKEGRPLWSEPSTRAFWNRFTRKRLIDIRCFLFLFLCTEKGKAGDDGGLNQPPPPSPAP